MTTVKDLLRANLESIRTTLVLVHKELAERNTDEQGRGNSDCFRIDAAYAEILDGHAILVAYTEKIED